MEKDFLYNSGFWSFFRDIAVVKTSCDEVITSW